MKIKYQKSKSTKSTIFLAMKIKYQKSKSTKSTIFLAMKIKNNSLFGESRSPKVRPEKDSTPLDIPEEKGDF